MANNKSIDGLSTRAVKKRVTKPVVKKPAKVVTPEDFAAEPTTNIWDSLDAKPKKKVVKKVVVKKVKKTPDDTPDFLKPVQAFDFDEDEGLLDTDETTEDMKNLSKEEEPDEDETFEENFSKHPKEKKIWSKKYAEFGKTFNYDDCMAEMEKMIIDNYKAKRRAEFESVVEEAAAKHRQA